MSGAQPAYGGTLRLYGPGSMDHVDPACAYYMLGGQILRLFARQLFTYAPIRSLRDWRAVTPVPDIATEIPSTYNAGLSASHKVYTVRLRPDVIWDTNPPRPVTAQDFIRGFKRMCNPVMGAGGIRYYTSTIRGMAEYCAAYAESVPDREATAADLAAFQNSHEIPGILAIDDDTLIFELLRPAPDFLHILAVTFASPAPVEYDAYVPDSPEFRRNTRSNGPYRLTRYEHGVALRMERNPVWRPESDPVRRAYVDAVEITMEMATPSEVGAKIRSGQADLSWASPVTEPYDLDPADPGNDLGYALNPYIAFNFASPNSGGAMGNVKVRQAIAYAVDKMAIAQIYHDLSAGTVMKPARTAIPPGNDGYEDYDLYPTPGFRGDLEKARRLLAEAGYEDGLELIAVHRNVDANPEVVRSIAADLKNLGITVRLVSMGHAEYYPFLQDPANAEAGLWDLATPSWTPDWFGNNGRAFLQPMFQTNMARGTCNYGCYSDPEVDHLIEEALGAIDSDRAAVFWHAVDRRVMEDAAIVPILVHAPTIPHLSSSRVRDAIAMPTIDRWFDLANLWLDRPD
jgi:peptide/nickel transport system substrate-binding protein